LVNGTANGTANGVAHHASNGAAISSETDITSSGRRRKPWTSPKTVLKNVGPKGGPFCKTVGIYFVLSLPDRSPTFLRCLAKCAPILSLIVFVLLHGINLSKEYAFARAILCGLVMSLLGDILLCYNSLQAGMLFFGLAHMNYVRAFGLRPLKLYVLLIVAGLGVACLCYLLPNMPWPMCVYTVAYMTLISTMVWRALARVEWTDEWTWTKWTWTELCSSCGAILFMISDLLIGVHKFVSPLPYEKELVMGTYYAAQLGIALSVVDSRKARKTE